MPSCQAVGCQTLYRENESQTRPWTPPYTQMSTETPEVLMLAFLAWGEGLPAGKHEIEIIERLRKKRAWEKFLAATFSPRTVEFRRRVISEIEQDEWLFKEKEIEYVQEMRFQLAQEELHQHEIDVQAKIEDRLKQIAERAEADKAAKLIKIHRDRDRAIRKLRRKGMGIASKYKRDSIIEEYSNPASNLFAPLPRWGFDARLRSEVLCVEPTFPTTFEGLCKLEIKTPKPLKERAKVVVKHSCLQRDYAVEKLEADIRELRMLYRAEKDFEDVALTLAYPSPPTPKCEEMTDGEENIYQSGLLLQRVIQGRAIQTMMHNGRQRRQDLIDELKSTFGLLPEEVETRDNERSTTMSSLRDFAFGKKKLAIATKLVEELESDTVAKLADFAAKELLRLQDERRAHALALIAERERWRREAQESGRRQLEQRQRRQLDNMSNQIVRVNECSIEKFMGRIINKTLTSAAREKAKFKVMEKVKNKDTVEMKPADSGCHLLAAEEASAKLMYNVLLPNIKREAVHKRVRERQTATRMAAMEILYNKEHEKRTERLKQMFTPAEKLEEHVFRSFTEDSLSSDNEITPVIKKRTEVQEESEDELLAGEDIDYSGSDKDDVELEEEKTVEEGWERDGEGREWNGEWEEDEWKQETPVPTPPIVELAEASADAVFPEDETLHIFQGGRYCDDDD